MSAFSVIRVLAMWNMRGRNVVFCLLLSLLASTQCFITPVTKTALLTCLSPKRDGPSRLGKHASGRGQAVSNLQRHALIHLRYDRSCTMMSCTDPGESFLHSKDREDVDPRPLSARSLGSPLITILLQMCGSRSPNQGGEEGKGYESGPGRASTGCAEFRC